MTRLKNLFEPYKMKNLILPNRIVFAGHGSRFVDPHLHELTDRQAYYLADRAKGGVGLIIQGSSIVHPTGLTFGGINQIWNDKAIESYRKVTSAVKKEKTAIFAQLSHLGRQGTCFPSQRELWAPSSIPDPASRVVPHAVTKKEINELIDSYSLSASLMMEANFDGLEIYMAHGYLLGSFLSKFSNQRDDEYGGSITNRVRLPIEVLQAVKKRVGASVPVGIRISAEEFVKDGLHPEEVSEMVKLITDEVPLDYISVSQSNYASIDRQIPDMSFPKAPFVNYAKIIRDVSQSTPVFAVARIVDPELAEEILSKKFADFVCMVRPLIADAELPNKAKSGRLDKIRRCISCNVGCRGGPHRGVPISCLVNPAVGFEKDHGIGKIKKAKVPKKVVIVGGGPAGLKTAETAALRGHNVTILEKQNFVGGAVNIAAAAVPYRAEFANATKFLLQECLELGVEIETGIDASKELVKELSPDTVVIATGSILGRPDIDGANSHHVVNAEQAIQHGVKGPEVIVIDSGESDWRVLTTAENLAWHGHNVTLVSPISIGAEIDAFSKPPFMRRLAEARIKCVEHHKLITINNNSVKFKNNWSDEVLSLPADDVVLSWFNTANDGLSHELAKETFDCFLVGDAVAPRLAINAIWDGFRVGAMI